MAVVTTAGGKEVSTVDFWELEARERIRELVADYDSLLDAGRYGPLQALFADDASLELPSGTFRGPREILAHFTHSGDQLAGAGRRGHLRHFGATHRIDVQDRHHATGRMYFAVFTPSGVDHWGRYVDTYRNTHGHWRFTRRLVIVDGTSPTSPHRGGGPTAEHELAGTAR